NSNLVIAGPIITNEQYSYAVAHGDPGGFLAKINSALTAMKADGTFQRILDKWLS
ncbi:MAG: transporter substrate-binding domain-containing protein, partial [Methanobacteriota archaeon]